MPEKQVTQHRQSAWIDFDKGRSIGTKGSEEGKIIRDEEHPFGARVTLEGKGHIAPFSITLGIYGLMFHTEFFSTLDEGQRCFELYKEKTEVILALFEIDETERDANWRAKQNQLMDEIMAIQ